MEIKLAKGNILVDEKDWESLKGKSWYIGNNGYVYTSVFDLESNRFKVVTIHRIIMCPKKGMSVDHINGNKLDNRRENLRVVTHQQNMFNMKRKAKSVSKFKGVTWLSKDGVWRVRIKFNYKDYYIGRFMNETDAAHAYDKAALELFGEFAHLNFPEFDYSSYEVNRTPTYNNRKVKSISELIKEKEGE